MVESQSIVPSQLHQVIAMIRNHQPQNLAKKITISDAMYEKVKKLAIYVDPPCVSNRFCGIPFVVNSSMPAHCFMVDTMSGDKFW